MEIAAGALITIIIQILKKVVKKLGSDWTILIVVVLTYIGAYLFNWGKGFVTADMMETWSKVAGYQFIVWGVAVKYILPKITE